MASPTPFILEFEYNIEGHDSVWHAHAETLKASGIHTMVDVISVSTWGLSCNEWPILSVVFSCVEAAKAYTFTYLGYDRTTTTWDVHTDDEVCEYVSHGKFLPADT